MTEPERLDMGQRIKTLRRLRHLKQEALARELPVSVRTVQGWERGKHEPESANLARLAEVLGVHVTDITGNQPITVSPVELRDVHEKVEQVLRRLDVIEELLRSRGPVRPDRG
jgi:transcriptional regulator with XRE-family HTH domain